MTINELITQYTYQKLCSGYEPNSSKEEIIDFLYYYEQFCNTTSLGTKTEAEIKKVLPKRIITSSDQFLVMPTYKFTDEDLTFIERLSFKQRKELETNIACYLKKLPKREVKDGVYTKEEIEFAESAAAMLVKFVWNNYINHFIEEGKWPIQCRDVNKYLLETDLASIIEVPSIRNLMLVFYEETVEKILTLRKEEHDFKLSSVSDSLLAKANFSFITKGFEEMFKYSNKRTFEIDGSNNEFTDRAYADGIYISEAIFEGDYSLRKEPINGSCKNIVKTINNL